MRQWKNSCKSPCANQKSVPKLRVRSEFCVQSTCAEQTRNKTPYAEKKSVKTRAPSTYQFYLPNSYSEKLTPSKSRQTLRAKHGVIPSFLSVEDECRSFTGSEWEFFAVHFWNSRNLCWTFVPRPFAATSPTSVGSACKYQYMSARVASWFFLTIVQ